jgi:hypothetical protein
MAIRDKGLGINLITLRDLLDEEPSPEALDGATVRPCNERARIKRWDNSGRIRGEPLTALSAVKFWVVLDCGEPGVRFKPSDSPWLKKEPRQDRYIPVGVGVSQEISDVEREEQGVAMPGKYFSWDEACEASSDLCVFSKIHES